MSDLVDNVRSEAQIHGAMASLTSGPDDHLVPDTSPTPRLMPDCRQKWQRPGVTDVQRALLFVASPCRDFARREAIRRCRAPCSSCGSAVDWDQFNLVGQ